MAHRHDHRLALNERFDIGFELDILDRGPPRRRKPLLDRQQLGAQYLDQTGARTQNLKVTRDFADQTAHFFGDLVALEPGQALQPQIEDRARLLVRQTVSTVLCNVAAGLADQRHQRRDIGRGPSATDETRPRSRRIGRIADQRNDLVEIGDGDQQPEQDVRALPCLGEEVAGSPGYHLLTKSDKGGDDVAQGQQLWPTAIQRQHVDAEARLQRGVPVQLIEHDVRLGVTLQFDDDAHAFAIALVAQIRYALDQLLADRLRNPLNQPRLVDLIWDLGANDRFAILAHLFGMGLAAHDDRTSAGLVGSMCPSASHDDPAGREIGGRDMLHQLLDGDRRVVEIGAAGVYDLAQVVRWDVGRHADRNALGA